jgi:hypothetical protein
MSQDQPKFDSKREVLHKERHVRRVLRAAQSVDFPIAEVVFCPDGTIRMVPAEKPDTAPISKTGIEPSAAA